MRRTVPLVVGALLVAALAGAGVVLADGDTGAQSPERSISVAGSGSAETTPDRAVLRVAVEATAPNASAARDAVAADYAAVTSALVALGVPEERIRTVNYDLYRDERSEKRARDTGREATVVYRASHALAVELNDTDRVGAAIDAAVDGGAVVHGVRFTLAEETRADLREAALREAMADARGEAETIAASADLALAGVHTARTVDGRVLTRRVEYAAAADAGGTRVSPGPVEVTASVQVTYNATA